MIGIIGIAALSICAGIVGTISGFGMGTIMMPLLLRYFDYAETILLVAIIHWFHGLWKVLFFRQGINWRLLITFGIPSVIMSIVGALIVGTQWPLLKTLFGLFLIVYVITLVATPWIKVRDTLPTAIAGGAISGLSAGLFGIRGAVRGAFLSAYDLSAATYISTMGAIGLLIDSTRTSIYIIRGITLSPYLWWGLLAFIPASFIGVWIGRQIVGKIPQEVFQQVVALFLLVFGLYLLLAQTFQH